jgi:hypothetical protein
MKKVIFSLLALFLAVGVYAQENTNVSGPKITFEEKTHDFGDITQGDVVKKVFTFKNTGTEPLILSNVQTTCGCTAPQWPREPIAPGASAELTIQFNSTGKQGKQNKVITIFSNATNAQERVTITTFVAPKPQGTK